MKLYRLLAVCANAHSVANYLIFYVIDPLLMVLAVLKVIKNHKMVLRGEMMSRRKAPDVYLCERTGFAGLANFTDER